MSTLRCNGSNPKDANAGHLRGWDLDCVDTYQNARSAYFEYIGISTGGIIRPKVSLTNALTNHGFLGGMPVHTYFGYLRLWLSGSIDWESAVGSDGYFQFSSNPFSSYQFVHGSPIVFRQEDVKGQEAGLSGTQYDWGTNFDPPNLIFVNFWNDFQNYSTPDWYKCQNTACTGSVIQARSFLPLVPAYNPVSNRTIYAKSRASSTRSAVGEDLFVYPGHLSYATTVLKFPTAFSTGNPSLPAVSGPWKFNGKSSFAPSVACADASYGLTYNCMLAWVDRGMWNGAVLYTYFRVNTSTDQIEFVKNSSGEHPAQIALVSKNSNGDYATGWNTTQYFSAGNIASPPSFVSRMNNESAVVWTTTP